MNNFSEKYRLNIFTSKKIYANIKLILFLIIILGIVAMYIFMTPAVTREYYGPNVRQQVEKQFADARNIKYDCLFIGASEIYYGINPDKISIPSYNFAFSAENFNQQWYRLQYLEKNNVHFKYLVLGMDFDYFCGLVDVQNYDYRGYFDKEYFEDYKGIDSIEKLNTYFNEYVDERYIKRIGGFIKVTSRSIKSKHKNDKHNIDKKNINFMVLKDNGQLAFPYRPEMKVNKRGIVTNIPKKLKIQEKYFDKIFQYTQNKNIRLVIVIPPKYISYDKNIVKEYEEYIKEKIKGTNSVYLNYQDCPEFKYSDFYDNVHLTEKGADKFTKLIDEELLKLNN